jgi:hypothetical protein
MTRVLITISSILSIFPIPAFAHVGHIGAMAGHDHWVIAATIALVAAKLGFRVTSKMDKLELQEE